MELSPNGSLLRTLSSLGCTETLSPRVLSGLTVFDIQLYWSKRKDDGGRFGHIDDIGKLRWQMYSKYQTEGKNLPPIPSALHFHLLRCNYVCLTLKKTRFWIFTNNTIQPSIGDNHSWNLIEGSLPKAIMTYKLPAPELSIDLTTCKCKKSKWGTKKCSFLRNGLKCTEVCLCYDFTNTDETGIFSNLED